MQVQSGNDTELNFRATQLTSGDGVITDFATYCNTPSLNSIVQSNSLSQEWDLTHLIGKPIKIASFDLGSYSNFSYKKEVTVNNVLNDHDILKILYNTFGYISLNVRYCFELQSIYQHKGILGVFSIPVPDKMLWTNGYHLSLGVFNDSSIGPRDLYKKIQCLEIPMGTTTTHYLDIPWNSVFSKHAPFGTFDNETNFDSKKRMTLHDPFLCEFSLGWIDNLVAVTGVDLKARLNIISEITSLNYTSYCNVAT